MGEYLCEACIVVVALDKTIKEYIVRTQAEPT